MEYKRDDGELQMMQNYFCKLVLFEEERGDENYIFVQKIELYKYGDVDAFPIAFNKQYKIS